MAAIPSIVPPARPAVMPVLVLRVGELEAIHFHDRRRVAPGRCRLGEGRTRHPKGEHCGNDRRTENHDQLHEKLQKSYRQRRIGGAVPDCDGSATAAA
jgi:hypothetical protein